MNHMIKSSGVTLVLAGLFFIVTNWFFSPMVDFSAAYSETLSSPAFLYRMVFATATVACLLFGVVGLFLYNSSETRARKFRTLAFYITFFGTAFILANEWLHLFVLTDMAKTIPSAIDQFDTATHVGGFAIGGIAAITSFSLGWILFLSALIWTAKMKRTGLYMTLGGLFLIPILSGAISPVWGGIIGSFFLGVGFVLIGVELAKANAA